MNKKIYVSGATGFQGGAIARLLISKGYEVISLSAKAQSTEINHDGVQIVPGNNSDIAALTFALEQSEKAIFSLPLVFDIKEAKQQASQFIKAAEATGISLVIFNTTFDLAEFETGLIAQDLKVEVSQLFAASSLNVIRLVPDIYLDNLTAPWSLPVIKEQGVLPYPIANDFAVPWISHIDLAKYAVSALDKPGLHNHILYINTGIFTGEDVAEAISTSINKKVAFVSVTPDAFEEQLVPAFGPIAGKEISNLYRYVAEHREHLITKNFKETQDLLDIKPQTLEEWVASINWS